MGKGGTTTRDTTTGASTGGVPTTGMAGGCCLPFCDFSDPNATCPGVGQSCASLYEEGINPPKNKDAGICVIPD